jgi:hypothetical protein
MKYNELEKMISCLKNRRKFLKVEIETLQINKKDIQHLY